LEVDVARFKSCLTPVVWVIVAALLVTAAPARAAGADATPASAQAASVTALSATSRALLQPTAASASQTQTGSSDSGTPFFRTKKGVAALALIAGGFVYTLYSKSHDRVTSPVR
jgi:hypothetical protein